MAKPRRWPPCGKRCSAAYAACCCRPRRTDPGRPWTRCRARSALPRRRHCSISTSDRIPPYRLLTEYFAFPEKFNFVDLPLPAALAQTAARSITLHFAMAGVRSDSDEARLLETVTARHLQLGCTPVVNLFRQRTDPIRITHQAESYPVLPDARRAWAYEVHSIEKVWRVQQTPAGRAHRHLPALLFAAARPAAGRRRRCRPLLGGAPRRHRGRAEPGLRDRAVDRRRQLRPRATADRHAVGRGDGHAPRPACPAVHGCGRRRPVP